MKEAATRIVNDYEHYYLSDGVNGDISREAFEGAALAFDDWAQYQDDDEAPQGALDDGADSEYADTCAYHPHTWYEAHHNPDEWVEDALTEYGVEVVTGDGNIMGRLKELGAYAEARAAFNAVVTIAEDLAVAILADQEAGV